MKGKGNRYKRFGWFRAMFPRMADETQLEVAERHIEDAKHAISRQRELIARLESQGIPVDDHKQTLRTLETMLACLEDREHALCETAQSHE